MLVQQVPMMALGLMNYASSSRTERRKLQANGVRQKPAADGLESHLRY